ncbi:WD40 repeat-like protein, partial [Sporormia fimetaria CBS 119925]
MRQTTDSWDRKGGSFLSRFMATKKKGGLDGVTDDGSDPGDAARPEGMDAQLFRHTVDNMGFRPKFPQPPAYIKVRTKFKKEKQFDRMFLAQELRSSNDKTQVPAPGANPAPQSGSAASHNPIWATEFSKDGKYLAAGGQDRIVRVWSVISTAEERRAHEKDESEPVAPGDEGSRLSAPVFQQKPVREYHGHTATILDLSWSKNNFLLSSSMDKTVRLWHITRQENLCTFKHTDFVPSIQFHPRDDRFFLAGSLDTKLRLWSIPDKSVAFWTQVPDMITAVSFTPDGKTCIAGTLSGLCMFYETEGLKYQTQIHVKSTRGQNAKGSKITGIQTTHWPPGSSSGETKLVVTSNDSRIRLYNLRDKSLEMKFKGHENNCSQIRASLSSTGHIVCGSEDRRAYIWSTSVSDAEKRAPQQRPVEMFEAHSSISTCAIMAPLKTKLLLARSEDPIYDLCNPPPITLVSKAESIISSRAPTEHGEFASSALNTPAPSIAASKRHTVDPTPQYLARSAHVGGNIIVTADYTGAIKVFRQDCAYSK